jgi:ketosteroid isomerase-like protein
VIKNQAGGNSGGTINQSSGNIAPIQKAGDPVASRHPLANFQLARRVRFAKFESRCPESISSSKHERSPHRTTESNDSMNSPHLPKLLLLIGLALSTATLAAGSIEEDKKAVAALDTQYQAAVEKNDAETMARIHHENMILVLSNGTVLTGALLEQSARDKTYTWEHQSEVDNSQVVRVSGDTAVVTAKLWLKGTKATGEAINFKLWFSDTYVRTPSGWRYFFGQAGGRLPE